ncbi:tail length tape measure protein [Bacillus cereus]|uniref:phage tail protein n=1 Tax=Bacillus paranthracis TaxID=2026186 RepID=UPI000D6B435D|nr:tail length tape measure protein [Bacillus paranthracis]MEC4621551.1 tail length tape measure protein [Bacillus paranthracis]PWN69803.1 tail length tape measure protein [Bacillus cereus]PWN77658.1 tail length tape measure protein [Bacillus cereus]HDR7258762.1 tail length tape measure protein [Bacillus paranthracis]
MATQEELVVQFRAETDQMRREIQQMRREMNGFVTTTSRSSREYRRSIENMGNANSEYSRRLRQMKYEQREAMKPHIEELKRTKLAYLDAAMSMATYAGSAQDLIAQVNKIGKAEKAANDEIMKLDRMKQASILQTIGMLNNMSTTSSKLQGNLQRMGNPLYNVSRGALAATNAMERLANRSSAAQLALEFLGPTANMKQLNDQIRIINQSVMGMGQAFLVVGAGAVMFYGKLHKANMEMNPKYAKAYKDMMESLTEALQPMRDAFTALMIPIYNFVNTMAKMVIAFNEAHPTLAKFIQGTMMLVPALTLLLLPLGAGMGLLKGYRAAFAALWVIIKPAVMVLAMASPVAWALAAAITGLALGFTYAYKNIEPFRNAVNNVITVFKAFWQVLQGNSDGAASMLTSLGMSPENTRAIISFGETVRGVIETIKQVFSGFAVFMQGIFALFAGDEENGTALLKSLGMNQATITTVVNTVSSIKQAISEFLSEIWSFMTAIGTQIAQFWLENGSQIKQAFSDCWSIASEIIKSVMPIIVAVFQFAWPIIKEIVIGTLEAIRDFIQGILKVILGIVKVFSSLFTGDWAGVWEGVKEIWFGSLEAIWGYLQLWGVGRVMKWLGKFGDDIGRLFGKFWGDIKKIWNDALADLYVFFGSKLETITRLAQSWGGMFKNFFAGIWDAIIGGIQNKMNNVVSVIGWVLGQAVNTVQRFVGYFFTIGQQIISGMINGIYSYANKLIDQVFNIGRSIKDTITGFFRIHSPSRVMRDIGVYVGQGLDQGMDSMINPLVRTALDMATAVKDGFSSLTDSIQMGDILPGNVVAPAIPSISGSYRIPSYVSDGNSSSDFGQQAMINSQSANVANQNDNRLVAAAVKNLSDKLDNLQVVMEGETVGRIVRPHVNEGNAVENTVRRYF